MEIWGVSSVSKISSTAEWQTNHKLRRQNEYGSKFLNF